MSKHKHSKYTLLLNADYTPLGLITWKRAITLDLLKDGVEVVEYYLAPHEYIQAGHDKRFPLPAVMRTIQYIHIKQMNLAYSRRRIFLRDNYTCQYCGTRNLKPPNLTIDHIIPKVIWKKRELAHSASHWENVVTCCRRCNMRKGQKTPKQAHMKLISKPKKLSTARIATRHIFTLCNHKIADEWRIYLPTEV